MKGNTVFEILTGVGEGKPSETSDYFNIEYKHALRGHLRPDQYESIYAISIPGRNDVISRGVLVYDDKGTLVFGAFISGDVLSPSESELTKFDELWAIIQAGPSVCPRLLKKMSRINNLHDKLIGHTIGGNPGTVYPSNKQVGLQKTISELSPDSRI